MNSSQLGLPLGDIVARLGGTLHGDSAQRVLRFAPLERAAAGDIAFITDASRLAALRSCRASCVILPEKLAAEATALTNVIVVANPYLYYARLSQWLVAEQQPNPAPGVHPSAAIDPAARLGRDVRIDACAVVEAGAEIGDGCWIGAGAFVGLNSRLGAGTRLHPRSTVLHGCILGQRCTLHSGAVVGSDGFGYARDEQGAGVKIPQVGSVRIGDDVEIGSNTTVDRGALDDTVIGNGVKIDNLVQVAHNVRIGEHTAIAGCVGISGSASIGSYCLIGGGVGIAGHLEIADRTVIGGMSLVSRSVRQSGHYTGAFPLDTHDNWTRNAASLRHLADLRTRVRELEAGLEQLQTPSTDPS